MAFTRLSAVLGAYADGTNRLSKMRDQAYHTIQRGAGWDGFSKTYKPLNDEGTRLAPKTQLVTLKADDLWTEFQEHYGQLMNAAATKDYANTSAKADVVVNGEKIMEGVPTTYLLWLDHALVDVRTFLTKLPTLPADEIWTYDADRGHHVSKEPEITTRTEQHAKALLLVDHSKEHPAQTTVVQETETVGEWSNTRFHGGIPADTRKKLLARTQVLLEAIRNALSEANSVKVEKQEPSSTVFDFITSGV
jgi:hypothetical protein